jgi:hypothetical protein
MLSALTGCAYRQEGSALGQVGPPRRLQFALKPLGALTLLFE